MSEPLPFALMCWIKAQQEKERKHKEFMAVKNAEIDKTYLTMMVDCYKNQLSNKEKIMLNNFIKHKQDGKNFSVSQRSCITNIYYKST